MDELPENLLKELECPVCLLIPRTGPVFQCILGHLVCQECQPRLSKCPVCQANFNKPRVTRNFVAETLLQSIQRGCRYEVLGCDFRSKQSCLLVDHEATCCHKPVIPQPAPTTSLSDTIELLHLVLPIVLLVLRILAFIMFMLLTFNTQLVSGPEDESPVSFFSQVPDFVGDAYNRLKLFLRDPFRHRQRQTAFRQIFFNPITELVKESFIFRGAQRIHYSLVDWAGNRIHKLGLWIIDYLTNPVKESCIFQVEGMIQHQFPDAWLPSSLSHLVWKPPASSASNITMVWWPANNTYTDGSETRQFIVGKDDCKDTIVRSCRWKLDLTGTPLAVATVILESEVKMVKVWSEETFEDTQEIIMTGVVVRKASQLEDQSLPTGRTEDKIEMQSVRDFSECFMSCPDLHTLRWIVTFKKMPVQ